MQNLNIQNLQNTSSSLPLSIPSLKTEGPSFQEILQNTDIQPKTIKGFKIVVILEHYTNSALKTGQLNEAEAKDMLDSCRQCKHHKPHKAPFSYIEKELQDLISELTTSLDPSNQVTDIQDPTLLIDQKAGIQELEQKLNHSTRHIQPETKEVAETLLLQLKKLLDILLKLQGIINPPAEEKIVESPVNIEPPKDNVPVSSATDTSKQETLTNEKTVAETSDPSFQPKMDTSAMLNNSDGSPQPNLDTTNS